MLLWLDFVKCFLAVVDVDVRVVELVPEFGLSGFVVEWGGRLWWCCLSQSAGLEGGGRGGGGLGCSVVGAGEAFSRCCFCCSLLVVGIQDWWMLFCG